MKAIPILLYHSVSADPANWIAPFAVSPGDFAYHLDLILESGRTPITVSDLTAAIGGRAVLPERPVLVTFDDGFADFTDAAEMLADRGIPSTLYLTTGGLRGRGGWSSEMAIPPTPMLYWSQLAEIEDSGVEIGAHTHCHSQLDLLRAKELEREVRQCKDHHEDHLGHEVPSFAYPHGFLSRRTSRAVENAGYQSGFAVMNAFSSPSDRVFARARLTVRADTTPAHIFAWLAERGAPVAPYPERIRTRAWRTYRRIRGSGSTRGVIPAIPGGYRPTSDVLAFAGER